MSRDARETTIAPSNDVVVSMASSAARSLETPSEISRAAMRSVHVGKSGGRTLDHRCGGVGLVGVARLHAHRDDGAPSPEVGSQQLLSIVRKELVEGVHTGFRFGDLRCDVLTGVVDRLAQQLCAAPGEVVVRRPAGRSAVFQHVGDGGRVRAALADEKSGRDDHPLAGTWHVWNPSVQPTMYVTLHNLPGRSPETCALSRAAAGEVRRASVSQTARKPSRHDEAQQVVDAHGTSQP